MAGGVGGGPGTWNIYSFSEITISRIFKKCLFETLKHSGRQVEPLITHHAFSGNHQAVTFNFQPHGMFQRSGCFNMQRLSDHWKTHRHSRPNLFGVELSSIKNSTAPPRKRHPHPLTCGILHLPCLPFSHQPELGHRHKKKLSTGPKQHHPL